MRQAGITRKKISVRRAPARKILSLDEYGDDILKLDDQIRTLPADSHLVFADECVFSARGFKMSAWSNPHENIEVEDRSRNQPCQAVCAAVCSCHGLLAVRTVDYSFDQERFQDFLTDVSSAVDGEHVYLFLDNCRVHHGKLVKYADYNITPIWNVAYHFVYNDACEKYWAQLKAHFRPLLLQKMLTRPHAKDPVLQKAVQETLHTVPTKSIPLFVAHGLRALRHDANLVRRQRGLQPVPYDEPPEKKV